MPARSRLPPRKAACATRPSTGATPATLPESRIPLSSIASGPAVEGAIGTEIADAHRRIAILQAVDVQLAARRVIPAARPVAPRRPAPASRSSSSGASAKPGHVLRGHARTVLEAAARRGQVLDGSQEIQAGIARGQVRRQRSRCGSPPSSPWRSRPPARPRGRPASSRGWTASEPR